LGLIFLASFSLTVTARAEGTQPPASKTKVAAAAASSRAAPRVQPPALLTRLRALSAEQRAQPQAVRDAAAQAVGRSISLGGVVLALFEHQKVVAKEALADQELVQRVREAKLPEKATKLSQQGAAIDQRMNEAREKASIAMDAAQASLISGMISGLLQIGAATDAGGLGGMSDTEMAAVLTNLAASDLTPEQTEELAKRRAEAIARIARLSDEKVSVNTALAATLSGNRLLASADRGKLLLVVAFQAYQKTLDDLAGAQAALDASAPPSAEALKAYAAALKRVRLTLAYLQALLHQLR
jgi:hypothetical protein